MYQTRGLFYPSLSQRLYQSNQGLKLAAKAVCHPKGELICLKSFRLPNDSNIDMKHNRHCFLLFPLAPCPLSVSPARRPCLSGPPSPLRSTPAPGRSCHDGIRMPAVHLWIRADRTGPCQPHPCLCQFKHVR